MGVFDDVLGDNGMFNEAAYGPQEGYAGVLLCASACDGHVADEEAQSLFLILSQKKLYKRLSSQQFSAIMDKKKSSSTAWSQNSKSMKNEPKQSFVSWSTKTTDKYGAK